MLQVQLGSTLQYIDETGVMFPLCNQAVREIKFEHNGLNEEVNSLSQLIAGLHQQGFLIKNEYIMLGSGCVCPMKRMEK